MKITQTILDSLTEQAKASPRLRMNLDLRNSAEDHSQRMLNALEPGTVMPIHRHMKTSETIVCVRWHFEEYLYTEDSNANPNANSSKVQGAQEFKNTNGKLVLTEVIDMVPGGVILNIEAGQWHSLKCLESGTILLEAKDDKYEPLAEDEILA